MVYLSHRQYVIVKTLEENNLEINSSVLCNLLNISDRTLRLDIKSINSILNTKLIESSKDGYFIRSSIQNKELLSNVFLNDNKELFEKIILMLLNNEKCTMYEMVEKCSYSESYIRKELAISKEYLKNYNLTLVSNKNTFSITGQEWNKRKILADMLYQEASSFLSQGTSSIYSNKDYKIIKETIADATTKFKIELNDIYRNNLTVYLSICIQRGKANHKLNELPEYIDTVNISDFADYLLTSLEEKYRFTFHSYDRVYLSKLIDDMAFVEKKEEQNCKNDDDFKNIIEKTLVETLDRYFLKIDYTTMIDAFTHHIKGMLNRLKTSYFFKNDLTSGIKQSYPLVYDVAVYYSYLIEKEFNVKVNEDEIGLISIYLGSLINDNIPNKLNVVCICPEYLGLRNSFLTILEKHFGQKIEISEVTSDFTEIENLNKYDLIISIYSSFQNSNIVVVSPFLTNEDIQNINKKINIIESIKEKEEIYKKASEYLHSDLFFKNINFNNKYDVINFLAKKIVEKGFAPEEFINAVIERERYSSTCFFNKFAIPHALDNIANETCICVLINDKPLTWDDQKIRVVILIALCNEDYLNFKPLYTLLIKLLKNDEKLSKIVTCENLEEFQNLLINNFENN